MARLRSPPRQAMGRNPGGRQNQRHPTFPSGHRPCTASEVGGWLSPCPPALGTHLLGTHTLVWGLEVDGGAGNTPPPPQFRAGGGWGPPCSLGLEADGGLEVDGGGWGPPHGLGWRRLGGWRWLGCWGPPTLVQGLEVPGDPPCRSGLEAHGGLWTPSWFGAGGSWGAGDPPSFGDGGGWGGRGPPPALFRGWRWLGTPPLFGAGGGWGGRGPPHPPSGAGGGWGGGDPPLVWGWRWMGRQGPPHTLLQGPEVDGGLQTPPSPFRARRWMGGMETHPPPPRPGVTPPLPQVELSSQGVRP